MRFWLREIGGWGLVILGLLVFYACYAMLRGGLIFETGAMTVIGVFVFRGGIHLLKIAVAARVCLEAQERVGKASGGETGNAVKRPRAPFTTARILK
jgi:hypothetical protein